MWRRIFDEVGPVVLAVGLALLLRIFVIDSFRIPSSSMFPTLLIGDHLFVDKLAYGPRVPFTDFRFPGHREPRRGDVVVFSAARHGAGERQVRLIEGVHHPHPTQRVVQHEAALVAEARQAELDLGRLELGQPTAQLR